MLGIACLEFKVGCVCDGLKPNLCSGLAVGFWQDVREITGILEKHGASTFKPDLHETHIEAVRARWRNLVPRTFDLAA